MPLEAIGKSYTSEWVGGSHPADARDWYKSIDGARRGQEGTSYCICVMPNGQKYELWFSSRAQAACMKMCNDRLQDLKEAVAFSAMVTGLALNK
tara:strand:+ start:1187 stop:1468 length:282 start_codon:yes stop_codon:yes gene_type:complete